MLCSQIPGCNSQAELAPSLLEWPLSFIVIMNNQSINLFRSVGGDPESTKMQDAEESDDFLYASLLFHEINAENLSDEDTGLIEEKVDENCLKVDEFVMNISDILEQLASTNIDNENISKFNICRSNICDGVFRGMARKSFSPNKKLSVKFTDDLGVSERCGRYGGGGGGGQ